MSKLRSSALRVSIAAALAFAASTARAMSDEPSAAPAVAPETPATNNTPPAPPEETAPVPAPAPPPPEAAAPPAPEQPMSEGRQLVVAYNEGFHWGLAPGVVVVRGDVGFALGITIGYGFDTGTVIIVPGLELNAYFTDPTVLVGIPNVRFVLPIDRFAPFVEAGAGVGNVGSSTGAQTGAALLAGGGFMVHVSSRFAIGAEASYQTITGTDFSAIGVGPILAIGF